MRDTMKDSVVGAIVGAVITGIVSLLIFFLGNFSTQTIIEEKTVETLSGYFETVNRDMTYEQALQAVYKENETLKIDNNYLKSQISELERQITDKQNEIEQQNSVEEINKIIQNATDYVNNADYVQALSVLNSIEIKTSEVERLINEYSKQYEANIIEQANSLQLDKKLDEAKMLINDALEIIPDSQTLKDKQQEIADSYPQNMTDVLPAYQCGGNTYKEYTAKASGATEHFAMGGVKYTNGITFNADINIFNDVSWAVYNLDGKYSSLEFVLCHVDGTDLGNETFLEIFYDGELKQEISLTPDMAPKSVVLDISGVTQLKMQVRSSGGNNPIYGLGNPMIY